MIGPHSPKGDNIQPRTFVIDNSKKSKLLLSEMDLLPYIRATTVFKIKMVRLLKVRRSILNRNQTVKSLTLFNKQQEPTLTTTLVNM